MRSFLTLRSHQHLHLIPLFLVIILVGTIVAAGLRTLDIEVFLWGFIVSFFRVSVAYVISLVAALVLALIATATPKVEDVIVPVLDVLQSFPSFALFPLLLVFFGRNGLVTIAILIVSMVWPLVFTIITGRKQIKEDLIDAAYIFGARKYKFLRFFLLPMLFPAVVTGSLIAWGEAWETIIAAEIIVQIPGIGTYLAQVPATEPQILAIGILALMTLLFFINKYFWLKLLALSTCYQQD